MRLALSVLLASLVLAACVPDPLAVREIQGLDHVWEQLQAGILADDPALLDAVLAPSADPELGQRIVYLLSATDAGHAVRADLLAADLGDLTAADGEIDAAGRVLKFESSSRKPATDGLPPFDTGLTIYIQLDGGTAGLLDTLAWSRRVE